MSVKVSRPISVQCCLFSLRLPELLITNMYIYLIYISYVMVNNDISMDANKSNGFVDYKMLIMTDTCKINF